MAEKDPLIIVDIGSHQTKSILLNPHNGEYTLEAVATTETTVDAPHLDVTIGVLESIRQLEKATGKTVTSDTKPDDSTLLCSSSTGGGLHMVVGGLISRISGESAQRAALGAGALLMDQFSLDDDRPSYRLVSQLRSVNPDILLLAGGTDGGADKQVMEVSDIVYQADIRPRFGQEFRLPLIFAGNRDIRDRVQGRLEEAHYAVRTVDNVRPVMSRENLGPAREAIYDAYMEHVIVHSPGYDTLSRWTRGAIIPTQAVVGRILYEYAESRLVNLLAVDVGGETTDFYSVYDGFFNRSLDADFGITYGIGNVVKTAGLGNVLRWLPPGANERAVRNLIGNMMINPPEELDEDQAMLQSAVAREAIRLALEKHRGIASRLKGTVVSRTVSDIFDQSIEETLIDLNRTHVVVGKGRVFSDQSAEESASILLDSIAPAGIVEVYVDRSSIMPHLGSLMKVDRESAFKIFSSECLTLLGTCIAPRGAVRLSEDALRVTVEKPDGFTVEETIKAGQVAALRQIPGETCDVTVTPNRRLDVGAGKGRPVKRKLVAGELGFIIDARGRPLEAVDGLHRSTLQTATAETVAQEVEG